MRKPESWFHDLGTKYVLAQVYFHLNQAGVMGYLVKNGPRDAKEIAKGLRLDGRILESLLDYAAAADSVFTRDSRGRYGFSAFGRAVLKRYGPVRYNFLDVRVGAYGPVWSSLDGLLSGKKRYGAEVKREGRFAEDGLYKSAVGLRPVIGELLDRLKPEIVVEFGADTGLIDWVAQRPGAGECCVLDRNPKALRRVAPGVRRVAGDLFKPAGWSRSVSGGNLFFSLHSHEFLARGVPAMEGLVRSMRKSFPGARLAVIEQPRLGGSERNKNPDYQWLYSQSNVLIHHLIGNGRILTRKEWKFLFCGAGCKLELERPTGFLGYILFLFRL